MLIFAAGCTNNTGITVTASGTIEATEINVASKVGGEIMQLPVNQGDKVNTGDILAVIDHSTLDLQLKQAEAGVDLAKAQLKLLQNGARTEDIQQAEEGLKQSEAALKMAEEDAKRMVELLTSKSVTQKQKDDADTRYTVALAQNNSAKQTLKKLQQWSRPEDIQSAEARLVQAKTSAELLKKIITDSTIVAPIDGIITQKPIEKGELVGAGTTIVTISKLDKVNLMIYVTEIELGKIKLGQQAEVKIDADPNRTFTGKVTYISSVAEFTPKNIQTKKDRVKLVFGVKIEIDNPDGTLKSGIPADATIKI